MVSGMVVFSAVAHMVVAQSPAKPSRHVTCIIQINNGRIDREYYTTHVSAEGFTTPGRHFFIPGADLLDEPLPQSRSEQFCAHKDAFCGHQPQVPGLDSLVMVNKTFPLANTYHRVINATGMVYEHATPCHRLANGDLGCHKVMEHPITLWNVTTEFTADLKERTITSIAVMCHGDCHVTAPGDAVMFDSAGSNHEASGRKGGRGKRPQSLSGRTGHGYYTSHITDAKFTHPGSHFWIPAADRLDEPLSNQSSDMFCSHVGNTCGPVPNVPGLDSFVAVNKTTTLADSWHRVISATGLVYKLASACQRLFDGGFGCHDAMNNSVTLWNVTTVAVRDFTEVTSSVAVICHLDGCHVAGPGDAIAFATENVFLV